MSIRKIIRNVIPYSLRLLLNPLRKFILHPQYRQRALYTKVSEHVPVDPNMVFYEAYHGESITGNPYAVFTYLLNHSQYKRFQHIWVVVDEKKIPDFLKSHPRVVFVRYQSREYARYLATAKYLINDTSFPFYFHKRREQIYANIWHGTPLKKMGMDIHQRGFANHKNIQRNFLFTDYFVSPNRYTYEKLLKSHDVDTLFNGQVLDTGYPRVDLMFQANQANLRKQLGIAPGQKVILYAPTWRGSLGTADNQTQQIYDDLQTMQSSVTDGVVLLKAHYYVEAYFKKQGLDHVIVPGSLDTNELLAIVDVLITDYSSIFFEFLPTGKPVIFYAYDEVAYQAYRGTYLPMDELPGPLCHSIGEVIQMLDHVDDVGARYKGVYQRFVDRFCYHDDGQATRRFVDTVFAGEPSRDLFRIGTDKTKILLYGGGFLNNGITASVINLLNTIDYEQFDVTLIDHGGKIKASKQIHMRKVPGQVHHLFRYGTWNTTLVELYRHVFFLLTGRKELAPGKMYKKEMERLTGLTHFDIGIDFGGYSPLWAALFAFGPFKRKSIYLHSDMHQELDKRVNRHYPHRRNLRAIFSLYDRFDKVISVSEFAHQENQKHLKQHVSDERKMDYVVNPIDYQWILDMKDWVGLRSYEVGAKASQMELGQEFPVQDVVSRGRRGRFDSEFGAEMGTGIPAGRAPTLFPLPHRRDTNFITIGRLSPEKDHQKLIHAFARIAATRRNVRLYIVGEGALEAPLKELALAMGLRHQVFLTGQLDNPYYLLNQCDCFVLSSNYEGQAIVLLEALILGKPVITTDIPGPRSVVGDTHGRVVDNSVDGLVRGMTDFLNGRLLLEQPFDYEAYQHQAMSMFYEKVCRLEDDAE